MVEEGVNATRLHGGHEKSLSVDESNDAPVSNEGDRQRRRGRREEEAELESVDAGAAVGLGDEGGRRPSDTRWLSLGSNVEMGYGRHASGSPCRRRGEIGSLGGATAERCGLASALDGGGEVPERRGVATTSDEGRTSSESVEQRERISLLALLGLLLNEQRLLWQRWGARWRQ